MEQFCIVIGSGVKNSQNWETKEKLTFMIILKHLKVSTSLDY